MGEEESQNYWNFLQTQMFMEFNTVMKRNSLDAFTHATLNIWNKEAYVN